MSTNHPLLRISKLHKGYDASRTAGMVDGIVGNSALVSSAMENVLELELPGRCNIFSVKSVIDRCVGYDVDVKQIDWCDEEVVSS